MAIFPNFPGIPPLINFLFPQAPTLLTTDTVDGGNFTKRWGVFKGGQPVISFDAFIGIDYRQGWSISDFPLEQGAFESYDKVQLPFDVRVKFAAGGTLENREALLQSVAAIAKTLDLYDVVTPEVVYTSVNVQHYDYRRTAINGNGLITIELWLLEVRIGASAGLTQIGGANPTDGTAQTTADATPFTSGAPPLTNTADPSGMTSFNLGGVQPQVPTAAHLATVSGPTVGQLPAGP
jgi:hypothetical protein